MGINMVSAYQGLFDFSLFSMLSGIVLFVCVVARAVFDLYLSPLSKFPGPSVAATTRLYEAYHYFKNDWLDNLQSLHDYYGPVVRIGPNELHFIDHQFSLDHHRRTDLLKCDNYYGLLNTLLGGLASPSQHSKRASLLRPLFAGETLAAYASKMDSYLEDLRVHLVGLSLQDPDQAKAVNLTHYLWAYTNDIMISYITGKDSGFLQGDVERIHDETRAFSAINLATILRCMPPIKLLFDIFPYLRRLSPLGWLDTLIGNHLEHTLRSGNLEKYHTSVLSRAWAALGPHEDLVTYELSQAIFIGNESLLSNLTFLLHHIIRDPKCVSRIRAELDELDLGTYGTQCWRDPRVMRLPYLDAVCRESTRLSSPGWHRQPRQIPETVRYEGNVIPPMTSLTFTLRLLELDPILFPDPETFKPERFLGIGSEAKQARLSSVAFGTGSRTCLGQHIARVVLRKTIVCLVYNFDISLWDEDLDKTEGYRYLDTYPRKGYEGYMRIRLAPRF